MEIGSFIELDLRNTGEWHTGDNVLRLNTARAGIYQACRLYGVSKIYMPYYQCPSVAAFLSRYGINIKYYHINENYEPVIDKCDKNSAFLIINYFGILSNDYIISLSQKFSNVIIDNSPAFYNSPVIGCYNIYSPRKFFGVPDGCYVIGSKADINDVNYNVDESSDVSGFLLKRIEKGCSAVYAERMKNEERLDNSDILIMSKLTRALLSSIDYEDIATKRKENFMLSHKLYHEVNLIDPLKHFDEECIPMVYPLVLKQDDLVKKLADRKIYTGRWWNSVLSVVTENTFEALMSRYMIPIPIDQRYTEKEIDYMSKVVFELLRN